MINYEPSNDMTLEVSWTYHRGRNTIDDRALDKVRVNSGFFRSYNTFKKNIDMDISYYYAGHTDHQDCDS